MKLFKSWQEKAIEEAQRKGVKAIQDAKKFLEKEIERTNLTTQIKSRIIKCLREKPLYILGTGSILIRSKNHKLAHDVVKELGITLKKVTEVDGFNYKGEYKGVRITVYGAKQAANCKIVSHDELRKITIYESVCE